MDLIQPQPQPLPHTLAAPGLARRYLASRAATWPAGLLDLVELLASEVVTNAVLHGRDPVELLLNDDGTRLKVGCRPHSIAPGKIVWFELRYPVS